MGQTFQLPLGVIHNRSASRDVVLNPMTAKTRRLLASRKNQKNPSTGLTELIGQCCESIAGVPPTPAIITSLSTGDRDFILLMLRKISIGDIIHAHMTCPRCEEEINFDLPIDDVKIRVLTLDEDYEIDGETAYVTLTSEKLKIEATLRFPTGHDQGLIAQQTKTDPVGATYLLYSRILKRWVKDNQEVPNPNSVAFIDDLPLCDIEWLEEAARAAMPGPDWMVNLTCEICNKSTLLDLSDTDFLFKTPR